LAFTPLASRVLAASQYVFDYALEMTALLQHLEAVSGGENSGDRLHIRRDGALRIRRVGGVRLNALQIDGKEAECPFVVLVRA